MKSALVRSLAIAGGLGAAGVLVATSAFAHGAPFTLKAGSAANGTTVAVTGRATNILFKDVTTGQSVTCASATLKGTGKTGTLTSGAKIAAVNASTGVITGCTGPAGLKFSATGVGTWYLNITDTTNGVSTGTISNVVANVKASSGPSCSFSIGSNSGAFSGTVAPATIPGKFTNSTQAITPTASTTGSLGLWNVKGSGTNTYCVSPSILKQGDKVSLTGSIKLTADVAAYNPLSVN